MKVLVIYDDRAVVPDTIGTIVRDRSFGAIVHCRRYLREMIGEMATRAGLDWRVLRSREDQTRLAHDLASRSADQLVARVPSALMPVDGQRFQTVLERLPYALETAVFQMADDEAVTLLCRDEALALLDMDEAQERRQFLLGLRDDALDMAAACRFHDLRNMSDFLAFMGGATETRHFNQMIRQDAVFRKSSRDKAKMRAEHDFFHLVPPQMKRFLIPTFDFAETADKAGYAMEAMQVPDGALQIIHNSFDQAAIDTLLDRFFAFIDARLRRLAPPEVVRRAGEAEMLVKLERRLADFAGMPAGQRVDRLLAAGGLEGGLAGLHERARAVIRAELDRDTCDHLALSHGDPCLSNILFDARLGLFRLIDPRGASRMDEAMMHPVYDLAKLGHSLMGGYDFINSGQFECQLGPDLEWVLELDGGGPPPFVREAFLHRLEQSGWNVRLVRACEMSLFLSMLPLHIDVPHKLPAFALAAHAILKELEHS